MDSDIRQLCHDTLYHYGKESPNSSCFVSNEHGLKLTHCGAEAIPIIEEVMDEVVSPVLEVHYAEYGYPDLNTPFRMGPPLSGLTYFFGAYWMICARTNAGHAVGFIKGKSRSVIFEAVLRFAVFFNKKHPLFEIELPEEYSDYMKELQQSGVPEYLAVVSHVAGKIGQPNTP